MGEVIAITSGKGGVGKTTFAVNIGCGLAMMSKKVLIIDGNNGLRNLEVAMGLSDFAFYNFIDYMNGKNELKEVVIKDNRFEKLYIIPAAQVCNENVLNAAKMKEIYEILKGKFDYVIIDTPSGVSNGFISSIMGIDKSIIISSPDVLSIRNADKIKKILLEKGVRNLAVIINKIDDDLRKKGIYLSNKDIDDLLGLEIIGEFNYDVEFPISFSKGEPLVNLDTDSGKKICNLCEKISDGKIILPYTEKNQDKKLFNFFRKK